MFCLICASVFVGVKCSVFLLAGCYMLCKRVESVCGML